MWGVDLSMCLFMYMCLLLCLFETKSYQPSDLIATGYVVANSSTTLLWCSVSMTPITMQQPTYSMTIFVGEWNQSCSFCIRHLQCCTWIIERMSIQKCNCFKSFESNAKLYHLALPTTLSALKHGWGMLTLVVVVNCSQPNHTHLAIEDKNESEQR